MKLLIIKSVLILVPFFSLVGLVELRLRYVPNEYSSTKAALDSKVGEVEILITGTSHAHDGVAAQFLSRPAFNLGKGSQSLYYDTQLVSKYVDSMPKLKLVIFGLSYHSLEYRLVNSIEHWRGGFYSLVYSIPGDDIEQGFELTNYSYIALYTPKEAIRLASGGVMGAAEAEAKRVHIPAAVVTQYEVTEAYGQSNVQVHESQMRPADMQANIATLERTSAMLKQRNVSVVFITVPTHHTYYDHINPKTYKRMQDTIKQITEKLGVPYFNYLRDERFSREDFFNSDHLNSRGAEKFSRILNEDVVKIHVQK